jgi:septal ring factor EnvC (AmiA/AmiB activator)
MAHSSGGFMSRSFCRAALGLACVLSAAHAYGQVTPDVDTKEIAAYKLTTTALAKVVNVNRALIQQLMQDPGVKEAAKIGTEIEALEKKDTLTEAEEKQLQALRARQEQLEDSNDNPLGGDASTLTEMDARIKKYPPLMQALEKEAMTPREYATFWLAFVQAAFVQGFKKSGMLKELPPDVNPENVKFMEEHATEIEAMQKEFEALGKKQSS